MSHADRIQAQLEMAEAERRPDDCGCWDVEADLPCWPCFRDGFDEQNPAEPAAEDDDSVHNRVNGNGPAEGGVTDSETGT